MQNAEDLSAAGGNEMKKILLATPTMHGEEQQYIQEAFETNWIAPLGPNVDAFEREIASYVGAPASAALSSGSCGHSLKDNRNLFGKTCGFLI